MTAINAGTDLTLEDGVAVVTLDFPPVNAMSPALTDGLYDALTAALADPAARAIVLICAGRTFIAGADLKSMGKVVPKIDFFGLQDAIENAPKPTIAALHGTPLGGGLETALTLHYRIAAPATRMGLPEVTLGLLPGGGGTQRLPRITGAEAALDLLLTGRQVPAREALAIGLIDRIAASEQTLRADAVAFARELIAADRPPQRIRDREDRIAADRADPGLIERLRAKWAARMRGLDAPQAIFRCVEAAVRGPWDAGLAVERAEFGPLLHGAQSAALRHMFMAERAATKIPGLSKDVAARPVRTVAIVGGDAMGNDIAGTFLDAGFAVTLVGHDADALERNVGLLRGISTARVARGEQTQDQADARDAALAISLDLATAAAGADLVVDAAAGDIAMKQALFAELGAAAHADAILATTTICVDAIASATAGPERVLGLHVAVPVAGARLLEVVRGPRTADDVLATALDIARRLRKTAVVSRSGRGPIGTRLSGALMEQVDALRADGVAPRDIDAALVDFGFAPGSVETIDPAGRAGPDGTKRLPPEEIVARLLYPVVNEGATLLDEGIALKASDIDVVLVAGYGWPSHTGGPMFYADHIGLATVAAALRAMPGITVAPLLERLAAEDGRFNA